MDLKLIEKMYVAIIRVQIIGKLDIAALEHSLALLLDGRPVFYQHRKPIPPEACNLEM